MTSDDAITLQPKGRLLVALLNRPPDNFIDQAVASALRDLCATLREDSPFDVLIIAGQDGQAEGSGESAAAFSRGTASSLMAESSDTTSGRQASALLDQLPLCQRHRVAAISRYRSDQRGRIRPGA